MATVQIKSVVLSSTSQWWVVNTSSASNADTITVYTIVQGTQAQAYGYGPASQQGGVAGPYTSYAAADAAAKSFGPNSNYSPAPGVSISPSGQTSVAGTSLAGLSQIGDFFGRLAEGSTWVRVAEVIIGLGLIVVGLAKLASGTSIGKLAGTVAKGAALA